MKYTHAVMAGLALALVAGASRDVSAQRVVRGRITDQLGRIDTTFAFDRNGTLTVNGGSGDITITGTSSNQAHVRAESDNDNVRLDVGGGRAQVEVTNRRGGDAHIEVSVPYGARVIVHGQSGDITIRGTRGPVEAHGQSGDLTIDDVNGHLDANTLSGDVVVGTVTGDVEIGSTSGDVKLTDVRGNIDIGTVSGDIVMRGITARSVRAKTTSGDVVYDGTVHPAGRYDLATHSGDVTLHVPRDASAQLTVSTWNGGIDSEFPMTLQPGQHGIGASSSKHITFSIGGGAARITAETFSGDITVSSNGHGARP
jgi:DUF4097 and DUF4098 domain-containing protein YvlB